MEKAVSQEKLARVKRDKGQRGGGDYPLFVRIDDLNKRKELHWVFSKKNCSLGERGTSWMPLDPGRAGKVRKLS